jgi:hypothetical protein
MLICSGAASTRRLRTEVRNEATSSAVQELSQALPQQSSNAGGEGSIGVDAEIDAVVPAEFIGIVIDLDHFLVRSQFEVSITDEHNRLAMTITASASRNIGCCQRK